MTDVDDEDCGEAMTVDYDRFTGEKGLRPAYYPVPHVAFYRTPSGGWRAILDVAFQSSGWMCAALGRTKREAAANLEMELQSLRR